MPFSNSLAQRLSFGLHLSAARLKRVAFRLKLNGAFCKLRILMLALGSFRACSFNLPLEFCDPHRRIPHHGVKPFECCRRRLASFLGPMSDAMSEALGVPLGPVIVGATTTDGMGFAGRGEGVAASATVLLGPA